MNEFMKRFGGIFAGLIVLASFMLTTQAIPSVPKAPAITEIQTANLESYRVVPAVLPAPGGLHVSTTPFRGHANWYAVTGATVYELRISPAGGGATTHFDRVLAARSALVILARGNYIANVRAGRSAHDVHGHWSATVHFTVPVPIPPCAVECRALKYAMTRIGDPYVYGAAGPSAFDCSGLVLWSYEQVGVQLPHNAAMQYGYGTHISRTSLIPGDLVFFYSPIGHVGIYVGGGQMVAAPHTGAVVHVQSIDWGNYVGATRIT